MSQSAANPNSRPTKDGAFLLAFASDVTSAFALGHADEFSAFLALAEAGSFIGAGQALGRHATLVTKRVQALEARLGVRLVERTTRRVRLTDAGSRLAAKLRLAADLMQEAQDEAAATRASIQGSVRLSLPGTMGRLWLAPRIPDLLAQHPGLHVEVHYSDAFVDLVQGGFDAAVRIGHLPDSSLVARKLAGHRRILCASPAYLERHGTPERPEDLTDHNCLEFTGLTSFPYWHLTDGARAAKVEVRGRLRGNDTMALLDAARAGVGILGAGEWATVRDVALGILLPVLPAWSFDVEAGIFLVRPSAGFTPARTTAVIAWIEELFRSGPPWMSGSSQPG